MGNVVLSIHQDASAACRASEAADAPESPGDPEAGGAVN
jgi:hypothetical protein